MSRKEKRAERNNLRLEDLAYSQERMRNAWNNEIRGELRIVGKSASRWHWNNRLHGHPVDGKFPNRSSRVRTIS